VPKVVAGGQSMRVELATAAVLCLLAIAGARGAMAKQVTIAY